MNITVLCKVVDNYGDIGVVFRLCRALLEQQVQYSAFRLVVSGLPTFSYIEPHIDATLPVQTYSGMTVLDWNSREEGEKSFTKNPPEIVLECFACGRPEWLDEILFDRPLAHTVQIVNIEYLTAEAWADDFHLLKSGTRSKVVKKINFMPGFTKKTGGLILNSSFMESRALKETAIHKVSAFFADVGGEHERIVASLQNPDVFCVLIFAYKTDFSDIFLALLEFQEQLRKQNKNATVQLLLAPGLSLEPAKEAWALCQKKLSVCEIPHIPQDVWDALLLSCDFLFVRGEDSFSRAALSGIPFVWQAYMQEEQFQLVKVAAFLERLKPFFSADFCNAGHISANGDLLLNLFTALRQLYVLYNVHQGAPLCAEAQEVWDTTFVGGCTRKKDVLFFLLCHWGVLKDIFAAFSRSLIENGNAATAVIDFLRNAGYNNDKRDN